VGELLRSENNISIWTNFICENWQLTYMITEELNYETELIIGFSISNSIVNIQEHNFNIFIVT